MNHDFYNESPDFDPKFLQRVRFSKKFYGLSKNHLKTFQHVGFWFPKKTCFKATPFGSFNCVKTTNFTFLCFLNSVISRWKFFNVYDFELKVLYCVKFWFETFSTCANSKRFLKHIFRKLKRVFYNFLDFESPSSAVCQVFLRS